MSTTEIEVSEVNSEEIVNSSVDYNLQEIKSWEELDLNIDLLRGIYAYGFEKPSAIQSKAIKPLMEKRDIVSHKRTYNSNGKSF